jgi:hypothetical protein
MMECSRCGEAKPISEFECRKGKAGRKWYRKECEACRSTNRLQYGRDYYQHNKIRIKILRACLHADG